MIFAYLEKRLDNEEDLCNNDEAVIGYRKYCKFKTFDSSDYSLIATIDTKDQVFGLCSSWNDSYLAVNELGVKLYDIGKTEEEVQEDSRTRCV